MKVLPFKIPKPQHEALVYQIDREQVFYDQLHQHAEIQISYVEKGAGALIVGDSINEYKAGDILVIGSFVPHVFRSDTRIKEESLMHTLFFDQDSFGKGFFQLADLSSIQHFFKKAELGRHQWRAMWDKSGRASYIGKETKVYAGKRSCYRSFKGKDSKFSK